MAHIPLTLTDHDLLNGMRVCQIALGFIELDARTFGREEDVIQSRAAICSLQAKFDTEIRQRAAEAQARAEAEEEEAEEEPTESQPPKKPDDSPNGG